MNEEASRAAFAGFESKMTPERLAELSGRVPKGTDDPALLAMGAKPLVDVPVARAEYERMRAVADDQHAKYLAEALIVNDLRREVERLRVADTGSEMIAAERARQINVEGWTPEHDDEHDSCEMTWAAVSYAMQAANPPGGDEFDPWPWAESWWKPSDDPVRNLVKAGALIAAEIDRLQRRG